MKKMIALIVMITIISGLLCACSKNSDSSNEWTNINYRWDFITTADAEYTHPQSGITVNGLLNQYELVLLQDASYENIAKLAVGAAQYNIDEINEYDPENWLEHIAASITIYQYGEVISEITLIFDKNHEYLEIFWADEEQENVGKFVSVEEWAELIVQ